MSKPKKPVMLVVDDEPLVRKGVNLVFRDEYEVIEASTGDAAIGLIASGLAPDIILSDIRISIEMNGIQFVHCLRESGVQTPVLFVSAYIDDPSNREAKHMPRTACIEKSYEVEDLKTAVENLLASCTA